MCTLPNPPFQVRTAGLIQQQPYHSTPGTRQNDLMLLLVLRGKGFYRNHQSSITVHGGMVGIIPPSAPGILMADLADPYTHYYCRFNGDYARALAIKILHDRQQRFFTVPEPIQLAEIFQQMVPYYSTDLPVEMGQRELLLAELLLALCHGDEEPSLPTKFNVSRLKDYLREHIGEPTDLATIATHFQLSKSTICRQARQFYNCTVLDLHETMKMEWACLLLESGAMQIREVAHRVGYLDPAYFTRIFRKHYGVSPRHWRRRQRYGQKEFAE